MKRVVCLLIILAGAGWWVWAKHDGDVAAAWAALRTSGMELAGRVTGSRAGPFQAGASQAGASQAGSAPGETNRAGGQGRPGGPGGRDGAREGDAPKIAVVTAAAEATDVPITRNGVGWAEPIATVTIRPRIDGEIIEQRVKDGQTVQEGEVLFRIDDREIQAQITRDEAALARDQATLVRTQADAKRVQELLTRDNTTQQRADQALADAKVAQANVAADQAALEADRIKLGYTTIKAPISGRVGVVRVTPGNLVRASETGGEGLVTITQLKPLRVSFALPERDLELLRVALSGKAPAPVRAYASGSDAVVATGTLTFVDSSVDITSGTITAKATFPNEDGRLWPGQYVRIEADVGLRPKATTVPLVAVQPGQDGSFAFVVKPDGTVERRRVELADTRGNQAVVASGIAAGERVVVEGQQRLKNGTAVFEKAPGPNADPRPGRTARAE